MDITSAARRTIRRANFRTWAWWELPPLPRYFVALVTAAAVALAAVSAAHVTLRMDDLWKFLLLLACGLISVAATPRVSYRMGGMTRDFITVWVLPIAVLLPPIYTLLAPIPLYILTQMWVHRGAVYRRVFTVAAIGVCYGVGSVAFHAFPQSFAGPVIGSGRHALTWTVAVIVCEFIGRRGHGALIMLAIRLVNPEARLDRQTLLDREALQADLAEFDLGVVVTVVVGVNAVLAVVAVPTVLLIRRFMMHTQLLAKSRIDTKTGLLNASTWESEATAEIARSMRAGTPVSVALIDIDHFKLVNDTHGHLAGDKVLKAMGEEIQEHLRHTDTAGRFGGEEFVVLLPNASERDALAVAERLRQHIEATPIPIGEDPADSSTAVKLTISTGVAALTEACHELTDLLAAADAALYHAKQHGRNQTHAVSATEHKTKLAPVANAGA